jgi:dephospho-CoA kinase
MNKLICLVGMCGSGKSVIADELVTQGFEFLRFGQITMDTIKERGLEVSEANEREVRESLRTEHGMGAFAILNKPKIDRLLELGNVVGDGLYSWAEYKILKEHYGKRLIIICVYAPPKVRYERLANRGLDIQDTNARNRPLTKEQAVSRDFAEIERSDKGGPIAMANYTLLNTGTITELLGQFKEVLRKIDESS